MLKWIVPLAGTVAMASAHAHEQGYERSLASDPNRFSARPGAARAAEKLGRADVATKYYVELAAARSDAAIPRP